MNASRSLPLLLLGIIGFSAASLSNAQTLNLTVEALVPTMSTGGRSLSPPMETTENWSVEVDRDIVIIPFDELTVPIQVKSAITLISKDYGRVKFSKNEVRAVVRTPLVSFNHQSGATLSHRPTLYISLCGFKDEVTLNGDGNCSWQTEMDRMLHGVIQDYQYKHFAVDWDTHTVMNTQVMDLASVVKDYLNARVVPWDVVIVGHSRGGVFAHELTKELVENKKIKNLHTFLLDPTASGSPLGDFYPLKKYDASPTEHYASLFYDGLPFLFDVAYAGTVGDKKIVGYNNYGRNNFLFSDATSHGLFAWDWVIATSGGLSQALVDIRSRKTAGTFAVEGSSGMETVRISRPDGLDFDGDITISDGNVRIWGTISIAGLPGTQTTIDATVSTSDGVQVAAATGLSATHAIINERLIEISSSTLLGSYSASVSKDGLSANVTLTIFSASASVDPSRININLGIAGQKLDVKTNTLNTVMPLMCFGFC